MRASANSHATSWLTLPPVQDWPHDTLRAAYEPFTFAPPRQELA